MDGSKKTDNSKMNKNELAKTHRKKRSTSLAFRSLQIETMRHCQHHKLGNTGQTARCKELGMQETSRLPVGKRMDTAMQNVLWESSLTSRGRVPEDPQSHPGHFLQEGSGAPV